MLANSHLSVAGLFIGNLDHLANQRGITKNNSFGDEIVVGSNLFTSSMVYRSLRKPTLCSHTMIKSEQCYSPHGIYSLSELDLRVWTGRVAALI